MLKKEIRILGIGAATRNKKQILMIGVVFRGSLWLDGILTCLLKLDEQDHVSNISRAIMRSKQYPQLRAVILSREQLVPGENLDLSDLKRRINLPVIAIAKNNRSTAKKRKQLLDVNHYDLTLNGKRLHILAAGTSHEMAQEILSICCTQNQKIPEAVRVADLIADQVPSQLFTEPSNA